MDLTKKEFEGLLTEADYITSSRGEIISLLERYGVVFNREELKVGKWYRNKKHPKSLVYFDGVFKNNGFENALRYSL